MQPWQIVLIGLVIVFITLCAAGLSLSRITWRDVANSVVCTAVALCLMHFLKLAPIGYLVILLLGDMLLACFVYSEEMNLYGGRRWFGPFR